MPAITEEQARNLQIGNRVRVIRAEDLGDGYNWINENSLIIGQECTISNIELSTFRIKVNEGRNRYWMEYCLFELAESVNSDIPEVTNRPLQVGDRLEVISNGIYQYETQDYIGLDGLHIGDVVTVLTVQSSHSFTVDGLKYIHQLSHFRYIDSDISTKLTLGTKSMPQVISSVKLGSVEKSIFQAIADKKKRDVYVYLKNGIFFNHPKDTAPDSIHIYFNCVSAEYYNKTPGDVNTVSSSNLIRNRQSSSVKTIIPLLSGDLNRSIGNAIYIAGDFLTPITPDIEDYNRLMYLVYLIYNYFSITDLSLGSDDLGSIISYKISEEVRQAESTRQSKISEVLFNIKTREQQLNDLYKSLYTLNKTVYTFDKEDKSEIIPNINKLPNIISTSIDIIISHTFLVIKTKPMINNLPHGDIPWGSMTIKISLDEPQIIIEGEYKKTHFHPHYADSACFGGFGAIIQKLLANNSLDVLIDIIMQWQNAYSPGDAFQHWAGRLAQQEIGILIDEGLYLSGEEDDE